MTDIKPMDQAGYHEVQIEQLTKQAEIKLAEYQDLLSSIEWHRRGLRGIVAREQQQDHLDELRGDRGR